MGRNRGCVAMVWPVPQPASQGCRGRSGRPPQPCSCMSLIHEIFYLRFGAEAPWGGIAMVYHVACPKCGGSFEIDRSLVGLVACCPKCGTRLRIGSARAHSSDSQDRRLGWLTPPTEPSLWRNPATYIAFATLAALVIIFLSVLFRNPYGPPSDQPAASPSAGSAKVATHQGSAELGRSAGSPEASQTPSPPRSASVQPPSHALIAPANGTPLTAQSLFARSAPAVVRVTVRDAELREIGLGSGFFIKPDGTLITNCHVIAGAKFAAVLLPTGATLFVDGVLASDEDNDLAVLKVNGTDLPYLSLADPGEIPGVGARVYAIGNPQGLTNTLSEGLVSGVRKNPLGEVIAVQTSAAISPGSSGGPLLDSNGRVVGVTTASLGEGQNLNFAVPCSSVRSVLAKIATNKRL